MRLRTLLLLSVSLLSLVPRAGADGMLDPAFGNGGLVTTHFTQFSQDYAASLVVLPDGRAVAVGYTSPNLAAQFMAAARYLVSGALDTTFGSGGLVTLFFPTPPGTTGGAAAQSVLLQTDGRLVLVGGMGFSPPPGSGRFALARLNPDGSLDPSFGTGGLVTTSIGNTSQASAGVLQPDGRIVAVGNLGFGGTIAAARYNSDGSLDPTFGSGGTILFALPGSLRVRGVALQPDGKLLITGMYTSGAVYDFAVVRLLPDGTLDPTFDGDGLVTSDFGASEIGSSVIVLPDGRIVLGGYRSPADFALVRYLPNGTLDATFGNGGLVTADSGAAEIADQLIRLPNGKLLLAGFTIDSGAHDFLLARFQPDGALDTSFGTAGFLRTGFPAGSTDECHAVAVAGPDLVLTAGTSAGGNPGSDFALARYIATTPVELLTFAVE